MPDPGHLLIVDDNRTNRLMLLRGIQQLGYTGSPAENGLQALEMLRSEPFDVVLLDIIMPEMDGFQVLERIKGDPSLRDIPVIVVSGLDEMESAARCIELGAEDYLTKPFNSILLRARLNASLEKKRYRDLERDYLQQELTLRQAEKLATLGRMAAGMAHELNNPVAAAQRGVDQLKGVVDGLRVSYRQLGAAGLDEGQQARVADFRQLAEERARHPAEFDPLARADLEEAIEAMLERRDIARPWEYADSLASLEIPAGDLDRLLDGFSAEQSSAFVGWLSRLITLLSLLGQIGRGLRRITHIVDALKTYSSMDQAPIQLVNVEEGLESALSLLATSGQNGITIRREFNGCLPRVAAYASQLNQVWSNILDNAVAAVDGAGQIVLRTYQNDSGDWVRIEVEDSGPGIPESIQPKVFDPFFTTKPPGEGAGLGLTLSHNIIVEKHHGRIELCSEPGRTLITVHLPVETRLDP